MWKNYNIMNTSYKNPRMRYNINNSKIYYIVIVIFKMNKQKNPLQRQ